MTLGSFARRFEAVRLAALCTLSLAVMSAGCGGSENTGATGAPPVNITPGSFVFPATAISVASAPQVFTINNTSSATLTRVSISFGGAAATEFTAAPAAGMSFCGDSLVGGATCAVAVSFTPRTPGEKMATFNFNSSTGTKTAILTGTATRPPAFSVTPADANFGVVSLGARSTPARMFVIKNEGTVASEKPTVTSTNPEFIITNNTCGAALAGGAMCTVEMVFGPEAVGARQGSLVAAATGAASGMATLMGMGQTAARLTVSPNVIEFPDTVVDKSSQEVTVTATNPSGMPLPMFTATASANDFAVGMPKCEGGVVPPNGSCTVTVRFAPRTAGQLKAELTLGVAGGLGTQVALAGRGLRKSALVLAPPSHDFGSTSVGSQSGGLTFTLRNDGQEDAGTVSASITGADKDEFVLVNNCAATVRSEASCTVVVSYKPMNEGASSASLSISGMPGGAISASLMGQGVPPAAITITPNVHDFGTVAVDGASTAVNFKVTNTGGTPSGKLSVSTVGTEFRLPADANGCRDVILAAGANCTLSVIFAPTSAGSKTSNLTVVSEAAGTLSASLSGTAIASPLLAIGPVSGNFGSVGTGGKSSEIVFTVSNVGGGPTGVVTVAPSSGQFEISSNSCLNKALAINESCMVGVKFAPTAVGDFSAKLVASATPGGSKSADLVGAGTMPPSLVFKDSMGVQTVQRFNSEKVGSTSAPVTLVLHNTSAIGTGMLATTIVGANPDDFAIVPGSNNCGPPLPASGTCSVQVVFKPTASGERNAVLNIMSPTGGVGSLLLTGTGEAILQFKQGMVVKTSYDFGQETIGIVTGVQTFTLAPQSATGTYTVAFDGGGSPANFAMTTNCNGTPITPPATCNFDIRFQPQNPKGAKMGLLTVTTSAGVTATLALTGTAIGPLQLTPAPHNFGAVAAGSTAEQTFTLRNNGPVPMKSVAVSLAGADFNIVEDGCAENNKPVAGGMCTIKVRFVPTTSGAKMATLTATGTYEAAGMTLTDAATVAISGNATGAAKISVTPSPGDFGMVAVGAAPVTKTFSVTNAAGVPMTGPVTRNIAGADFTLTRNGCLLADNMSPRTLAAGETCTFDVVFTPSATGPLSGTLTVIANPGGTVTVPLTGTGLSTLLLSAAAVDLDKNEAGAAVENVLGQTNGKRRISVTNRGAATVALMTSRTVSSLVGATADGPTYFLESADSTAGATPCGPTLAAGATCSFELTMVTPGGGTAGAKKAVFNVIDSTAGKAVTSAAKAELSGTLLRDANIELVDVAGRDFGGVVVGVPSGLHTVQLRNSGGVKTGALQLEEPAMGFARVVPASGTNPATGNTVCNLGQQIAPNQVCDFLLQFTPAAPGMASSSLKIYVTGPGSMQAGVGNKLSIALTGTGLAAMSAPLTPSPVDFGSAAAGTATPVDKMVTFTNNSGAAVTIMETDITFTTGAAAGFSKVMGGPCVGVIGAGLTCAVTVRFQPGGAQAPGPVLDKLKVLTSEASLVGNVTRAPALEIIPPAEGADWGEALVGIAATKRVFTIRNKGGAATADKAVVTITGAQAAQFSVQGGDDNCTAALPAGGSCTVAITLLPSGVGVKAAAIDATATGATAAAPVVLAANGVLPSAFQIVSIGGVAGPGVTVGFGNKAVGSETAADVVVKNADTAQKAIAPMFVLGDAVNFRLDLNPAGVANACTGELADGGGLEGGEACTLRIYFRPQALPAASVAAPNMNTTLAITGAAMNLTLNLQGNAVSALSINPTTFDFGSAAVNTTSTAKLFTVTNSSDTNIGPTGQIVVARTGANPDSYRIVTDTCTGATLAPGISCGVSVVFEPKSPGAKPATLTLTSPSTDGTTAVVAGTGT